jgi:MFS transporter, putative metabolite:H+ symporter
MNTNHTPAGSGEGAAEIVARLERVPISGFHNRARLAVGSCTLFDGFDSMSLTYVLPVLIPLWNIAPAATGFLISASWAGSTFGALVFSWVAERWGRVKSLQLSVALMGIMSFLSAFAWDFNSLIVCRVILGFALGGEIPVAAAYISEIAKAKGRGQFMVLFQLAYAVGMVLVSIAATWIVPNLGWQALFIIGAVPAIVVIYLRRNLPESPRWLANAGRYQEADAVLKKIEMEATSGHMETLAPLEIGPPFTVAKSSWQELFQGIYLRRTFLIWGLGFCVYFGSFALAGWAPSLYTSIFKLPLKQGLQYAMITQIIGLFGAVTAAMLLDRIGRKVIFSVSFLVAGIAELSLWYIGVQSAMHLLVIISIAYFCMSMLSPSMNLYMTEMYPTRLRAIGGGVGTLSLRIASVIAPIVVGLILPKYALDGVFLMFGCILVAGFLVMTVFGIETKGKVLESLSG